MQHEISQEEAERHNVLTERGWALVKGQLFFQESAVSGKPGWFSRRKLKKAIQCFEQSLEINPDGWFSMFGLGKIYQRLGDHKTSFKWFASAHKINPTDDDVAGEAGLAALDCGEFQLAIQYCSVAIKNNPNDAGHICNLALAYMLAGDDSTAVQCATEAVDRNPDDETSKTVLRFVKDVYYGKRPRPSTLEEVFPN